MNVDVAILEVLFDQIPNAMFFVKDLQGRYLVVNDALVKLSGKGSKARIVGRSSDELFHVSGPSTETHDLAVMRSGKPQAEELRMFYASGGQRKWCVDSKYPLHGSDGKIVGLVGISRMLARADEKSAGYSRLRKFVDLLGASEHQGSLRVSEMAKVVNLSADTLERLCREVYGIAPKQLIMRHRIERACRLLEGGSANVADIAADCGYSDQSAFSRQFKAITGCTPIQFRVATQQPTRRK